jgi:hypothetical protein
MEQQSLGAYFQCYKNPYATYKCLESFRKYYPHNTVVLLSNNGYDYTNMAKHFNCIYIHSNESIPFVFENMEPQFIAEHMYKSINRYKDAFQLIKEEYVLWLEDDVVINNIITGRFNYHLNGFCCNTVSRFWNINKIKDTYNFISPYREYVWTGHGGSVFNKNEMLRYFENNSVLDDLSLHWELYKFPSNICHDFFLSMLIHFNNGTIGPYEGHADGVGHIHSHINVQHQYKVFYNMELPDNLKHLCKTI